MRVAAGGEGQQQPSTCDPQKSGPVIYLGAWAAQGVQKLPSLIFHSTDSSYSRTYEPMHLPTSQDSFDTILQTY